MMHPDRMPSISVGIIVPVGAVYDTHHHWRNDAGELRASVAFQAGGYSRAHLQGDPVALRELAAALVLAADQAEQADPAEQIDPAHPAAEAVVGS
jgi:hypothetical protein